MAPYNSSRLCDGVRMAASNPAAQLDILQNLVANTRSKLSAQTVWLGPLVDPSHLGGLQPVAWKTGTRKGSDSSS